jgi:hypothetical protein
MGELKAEAEDGHRSYEPSQDSSPPDAVTTENEKDVEKHDSAESPDEATAQYLHGKRLSMIVLCLMLSTFLVALDNVSD